MFLYDNYESKGMEQARSVGSVWFCLFSFYFCHSAGNGAGKRTDRTAKPREIETRLLIRCTFDSTPFIERSSLPVGRRYRSRVHVRGVADEWSRVRKGTVVTQNVIYNFGFEPRSSVGAIFLNERAADRAVKRPRELSLIPNFSTTFPQFFALALGNRVP